MASVSASIMLAVHQAYADRQIVKRRVNEEVCQRLLSPEEQYKIIVALKSGQSVPTVFGTLQGDEGLHKFNQFLVQETNTLKSQRFDFHGTALMDEAAG